MGPRDQPWEEMEPPGQAELEPWPAPWPCLETDPEVDGVFLPETSEALPVLGSCGVGTPRLWELPYPGVESAANAPVEEVLDVALRRNRLLTNRTSVLLRGPPRPPRTGDLATAPAALEPEEGAGQATSWSWIGEDIDLLVALHVEAMHEIVAGSPPSDGLNWGRANSIRAIRPLDRALAAWTSAGRGNEPQMALIVRLARELRLALPAVCQRPRVVLARDRQLQPVHRVDQLDPACLRWLARQPGRSTIEKAGPRQRVLSVVRQESADTLENRVVRDLALRALRASDLYQRQNRRFFNHARVTGVRRFGSTLRRLLLGSPLASVQQLTGIPAPNYVLLHDPRYRPLWDAYQRLVRQQRLLDSAWRWQRRVWAESCLFAALSALLCLPRARLRYRADVVVSSEHVTGRFMDPSSGLGSVALSGERQVDVVQGAHAESHPEPAVKRSAALKPDLVLVLRRGRSTQRVLCLWSLIWPPRSLPRVPEGLQGLVIVPRLLPGDRGAPFPKRKGVGTIELPLPAQTGVELLADCLSLLLGGGR